MGWLLSLFTGPIGGVISGVFGSIVTNVFNYFKQKQAHQQKIEIMKIEADNRKLDHQLAMVEAEMNMKITTAEIEGQIEVEDARAFVESQKRAMVSLFKASFMDRMMGVQGRLRYITIPLAGVVAFLFGIVDFIKHLMRPGMTVFLVIVLSIILRRALGILETSDYQWGQEEAVQIVTRVVMSVMYLTEMVFAWWFSDRRIAKFQQRLNDGTAKGDKAPF